MSWSRFLVLIIFSLQLPGPRALADSPQGLVILPSFSIEQQGGRLSGTLNTFNLDIRAGYRISSGFFFGLIFSNTATSGTNTLSATAIGNSVGYFYGLFAAITTIYLYAQENETSPTQTMQRSNGLGFQQDLALLFPISGAFRVGPILSYKSITYGKQQDSSGTIANSSQTVSSLLPFLALELAF